MFRLLRFYTSMFETRRHANQWSQRKSSHVPQDVPKISKMTTIFKAHTHCLVPIPYKL